jgi:hypothetical protein
LDEDLTTLAALGIGPSQLPQMQISCSCECTTSMALWRFEEQNTLSHSGCGLNILPLS